jgi:hypothetical protein
MLHGASDAAFEFAGRVIRNHFGTPILSQLPIPASAISLAAIPMHAVIDVLTVRAVSIGETLFVCVRRGRRRILAPASGSSLSRVADFCLFLAGEVSAFAGLQTIRPASFEVGFGLGCACDAQHKGDC